MPLITMLRVTPCFVLISFASDTTVAAVAKIADDCYNNGVTTNTCAQEMATSTAEYGDLNVSRTAVNWLFEPGSPTYKES